MFKTGSVSARRSKSRQNRRIMRIEPLEDVNTDGYVRYFDPKSPQLSLLGGSPIAAAIPSGRLCRYAFYDAENGNSMTSSEEDPLLSINAFSGTITVLRPMTDTERASAQVFTIKAYDSIYNDLYDLATLTIYAMDYGLTPYTPQTWHIDPMAIEETAWNNHQFCYRLQNKNKKYDNIDHTDIDDDARVITMLNCFFTRKVCR